MPTLCAMTSTLLTLACCCRGVRSSQQQCSTCHTMLPTPYLLSLHVSEQHDSFFASQAAQRMPVFQCLVEGCNSTFCLAAQRHQHLSDFHQIPTDSGFDRYGPLTICACKIVHTLLHATWLHARPCDTLAACSLGQPGTHSSHTLCQESLLTHKHFHQPFYTVNHACCCCLCVRN